VDFGLLVILMMLTGVVGLILAVLYWFLRYSFGTDQEKAEMGELNKNEPTKSDDISQ
tara:strand:+ start:78213 stop:78383 length:171 start_codon:yes stop_codon:yes gene_type:complete